VTQRDNPEELLLLSTPPGEPQMSRDFISYNADVSWLNVALYPL
jgi:hypothetical protein